jgi:hypothetical protein
MSSTGSLLALYPASDILDHLLIGVPLDEGVLWRRGTFTHYELVRQLGRSNLSLQRSIDGLAHFR